MLLKRIHLVEPLTGLFQLGNGKIAIAWGQHYSWLCNDWEDMLDTRPSTAASGYAAFNSLGEAEEYLRCATLSN